MYCVYIFLLVCCVIAARICFMILFTYKTKERKVVRTNPVKTMIILGSGGHTAEMIRILNCLNLKNYSPRIYVYADTDIMSMEKIKSLEKNNVDCKVFKIRRSREIHQSYYTSIYTTIYAILESIPILWRECPELILCNGPSTCVPLCITAFLFKIFYIMQPTIIFVESFCRVKTLSLTGKILYCVVDHQIVQWPYLCKPNNKDGRIFYFCTFIAKLIPWDLLVENVQNCLPIEMKVHLSSLTVKLKDLIESKIDPPTKWIENSLILVEACLDKTWETLNSGYWKFVPIEYRYCYSLCVILKALLLEFQYENDLKEGRKNIILLKNVVQQIDKGILLGAPFPNVPHLLPQIASELNHTIESLSKPLSFEKLDIRSGDVSNNEALSRFTEIIRYDEPSMELFYRDMFMPKVPAILTGCIKHWKALTRWQDLSYLARIAGNRMVPIEIGSRYTDEDWTQQLSTFSEFLHKYISTKSDKVGYLAQHQLFDQIPELKEDFMVPEYCNFTDNDNDTMEAPDINAWFGPMGTVSPLHFDPKNNLLCQVFGHKRVILYHPDDSANLYPYDTKLLNNTAQVDPLNPNDEKWPNFGKAKGLVGHLKPGEVLYIPPKWWHHVTALTPSFSISFWWN